MKMKSVKALIFALVMALMAAGCATSKPANTDSAKPAANSGEKQEAAKTGGKDALKITIAGGSAGGFWAVLGEGMGVAIKRAYPDTTFTYQPGQDGANVITVTSGKAQFGINQVPLIKLAMEGKPPYNKKIEDVRAVLYMHSTPYHFLVTKDSGINSIEQIVKDKYPLVASVNTKDSSSELMTRSLFEAYGSNYQQIEKNGGKIQYIVASKANDQVKDGKMQALITPTPLPVASFVELNTSKSVKLLPIDKKAVDFLQKAVGAKPDVIKAGSYDFVKEDVPTASIDTLLIASANTPEDLVYKITKAIYEQLDYLYTVHTSFKEITKETITQTSGIPLHPGAVKYYKEIGLMK